MTLDYSEGATPLDPDLLAALLPDLSTQGELNEWEAQNIATTLRWALCGDAQYQLDNAVYLWDELAARFHHRLVPVHPFPNGNGRHARLATDLLLTHNGQPIFSWGSASLIADSATRREYLYALREADQGDYARLLRFVRS